MTMERRQRRIREDLGGKDEHDVEILHGCRIPRLMPTIEIEQVTNAYRMDCPNNFDPV